MHGQVRVNLTCTCTLKFWNIKWKIFSYVDEVHEKRITIKSVQIIPRNSCRTQFNHVWIYICLQFTNGGTCLSCRVGASTIKTLKYQWRGYVTANYQTWSLVTYSNDWKNLEVSKTTKMSICILVTQLRSVL